ncbi:hypothetical protein BJ166DRAFT_628515 [Pestalotiopsis sp. NC0098]|nr:hypothetical protein BJ166DRAFT_628515 [Pestalotiopsis sp. NC0098]
MFATAPAHVLGMLLPFLATVNGHAANIMNAAANSNIGTGVSTGHDGLASPFDEKPDADSAWAFTLWSGMQCSGVQVQEYGGALTDCVLAAPPSYLGLTNNWVAPEAYVVFFHSVDCSGVPLFTLTNTTDVAGCWVPNAGEAIWSYQVKTSDQM